MVSLKANMNALILISTLCRSNDTLLLRLSHKDLVAASLLTLRWLTLEEGRCHILWAASKKVQVAMNPGLLSIASIMLSAT